jgi:ferric enterobactin receptor
MGLKQWLGNALLLLMWSTVTLFAQDAGSLRLSGRVTDSTGAGLASSELEIINVNSKEKLVVTSAADGRYEATVTKAGYYAITVKKEGFADQTTDQVEVRTGVAGATLNITMLPSTISTSITVTSSEATILDASREVSTISLAPEQLIPIPSLGEQDIFRAFQLLPGVAGSNETSAGIAVRGGRADQTFVDYDGFRAYGVDHLFGYFSAFNTDALQRMELSKGGFEAKKGGVLSGFVDLTGKTGRLDRPEFTLGISLLSVHGQFQTPIVTDKMSIIGSYRRSFQSPLFNKILNTTQVGTTTPRGGPAPPANGSAPPGFPGRPGAFFDSQPKSGFYDGNAKYLWKPSSEQTVTVSYYTGKDEVDNSRTLQLPTQFLETLQNRGVNLAERGIDLSNPNLNITDLRVTRNTGIGMEWAARINSRISTNLSMGESRFQDLRNRSFQAGNNTNPASEDNRIRDLNLRASVSVAAGDRNTFETGLESTVIRYQYGFQSAAPPRTSSSGQTTTPLAQILNEAGDAQTNAVFVQDRFVLGSRILLNPGVRLTTYDRTQETYTEPRFAAYFHANDRLQFKMALGQYHQFTSKVTREDLLQGNRYFWTAADGLTVPVSSSKELIVGASYQRGQWLADVEAYAKNLSGLSLFAPRFSAAVELIDYRSFFYTGSGQARGIDVLLQKQSGPNTGWLSYTLSKVTESFPTLAAGAFPADQDQRHELKIVDIHPLNIHPLRGWKVSGTWILSSGHPYTAPGGIETITLPFDETRTFERVVAGPKNGERLPAYHRLDLSLTREIVPLGDGGKGVLAISVFNVYNRKNVWYKEFNAVAGALTENNIRLMGTTLNVSFTISSGTKSW